ncbi:MAG: PEP-CTERM sorting domain-containing protein [Candidatus Didemnitutus sp.]|nr:PEP-CTERM sorting domain-containing protein [Candidatus Didemnitutus sp.]
MKSRRFLRAITALLAGALATVLLRAQASLYGSDDFNDNTFASGRWSSFGTANGGLWTETNGRFEFTADSTSTAITTANRAQQFRVWSSTTSGNSSYTDSWAATMTFTLDKTAVASNGASLIGFETFMAGTASGYYGLYLQYATSGGRIFAEQGVYNGSGYTRTTLGSTGNLDNTFDATEVLLKIAYNGSTSTFTSGFSFDAGSTFYTFGTWTGTGHFGGLASGATANWAVTPTTGFGLELYGALYGDGSSAGPTLVSGQAHADNLAVSAVPEPATYAAFAGLGALGLVWWRRRQLNAAA